MLQLLQTQCQILSLSMFFTVSESVCSKPSPSGDRSQVSELSATSKCVVASGDENLSDGLIWWHKQLATPTHRTLLPSIVIKSNGRCRGLVCFIQESVSVALIRPIRSLSWPMLMPTKSIAGHASYFAWFRSQDWHLGSFLDGDLKSSKKCPDFSPWIMELFEHGTIWFYAGENASIVEKKSPCLFFSKLTLRNSEREKLKGIPEIKLRRKTQMFQSLIKVFFYIFTIYNIWYFMLQNHTIFGQIS